MRELTNEEKLINDMIEDKDFEVVPTVNTGLAIFHKPSRTRVYMYLPMFFKDADIERVKDFYKTAVLPKIEAFKDEPPGIHVFNRMLDEDGLLNGYRVTGRYRSARNPALPCIIITHIESDEDVEVPLDIHLIKDYKELFSEDSSRVLYENNIIPAIKFFDAVISIRTTDNGLPPEATLLNVVLELKGKFEHFRIENGVLNIPYVRLVHIKNGIRYDIHFNTEDFPYTSLSNITELFYLVDRFYEYKIVPAMNEIETKLIQGGN